MPCCYKSSRFRYKSALFRYKSATLMLQKCPNDVTKVPQVTNVPYLSYKSSLSVTKVPVPLALSLSLSVTAQTNLMKRHAFDAADSLARDLYFHFHVPCRTISQFPIWMKIETIDSSIQVA